MTLLFRIILIVVSLIVTVAILHKVACTKAKTEDSIFWLALCVLLIVLSVFPQLVDYGAALVGIYSPINFIFLFFIFILIVKVFFSSIRISKLDLQIQELTQRIAVDEKLKQEKLEESDDKLKG